MRDFASIIKAQPYGRRPTASIRAQDRHQPAVDQILHNRGFVQIMRLKLLIGGFLDLIRRKVVD